MAQTFTSYSGTENTLLGVKGITSLSTGTSYSGTTYTDYSTHIPTFATSNLAISSINQNTIMQNKVAVFKVTRNDENKITSTEFIKELWIETKNGQSVEFEVARDKDLAKYKAEDLSIRVIFTVTF